jgi:protein-L-isoaspartate(D-aspartate) O-methyltransferase
MDSQAARLNMVNNQIRTNGVRDPLVLDALADVPRDAFLPKALRCSAYLDQPLDLGDGRQLIEPLVIARLLQGADIRSTDLALVIGDATGYVTALMARLTGYVVALDCDAEWQRRAQATLHEVGASNVELVDGALASGYPSKAPYDVIVFCGGVAEIPQEVCRQLSDGGRLVAVVKGRPAGGQVVLVVRAGDTFGRRVLYDAAAPALPTMDRKRAFAL